jgi:hypothetical protein
VVLLFALPAFVLTAMAVFFLPMLIHGLDRGLARVSVDDLANGPPEGTRNLELSGLLDTGHAIHEVITYKGSRIHHYLVPLVPRGWTPAQPVHVVVEAGKAAAISPRGPQLCTLRNVLWEGLSGANRRFFSDHGLRMADDLLLCELTRPGANDDLAAYIAGMGTTAVALIIVVAVVGIRLRRASARPRR